MKRGIDVDRFHTLRCELGQKKYGAGRENAGWRRDNGRDVLEELSDAVVISGYWHSRLKESGRQDLANDVESLAHKFLDLMETVENLRALTPGDLVAETGVTRFPPAEDVAV